MPVVTLSGVGGVSLSARIRGSGSSVLKVAPRTKTNTKVDGSLRHLVIEVVAIPVKLLGSSPACCE